MDLEVLKIASNTDNNKFISDHTHISKHKNPLCGDEMEITLKVKIKKFLILDINVNLVFIVKLQ